MNFSVQHIECIPTTIHHYVPNCSQLFVDDSTVITVRHSHGIRSQNLHPRCVLAFAHGHMVILREVRNVWKSAHTLYVQISTSCSYAKKVKKKKCIDTMHHIYVLVSERGGGDEKRLVFASKTYRFLQMTP